MDELAKKSLQEPAEEATNLADVLAFVLKHSKTQLSADEEEEEEEKEDNAWDVKDVCRLLQVSRGCRQVLQQSCKCNAHVQFDFDNKGLTDERSKLSEFAEWLPMHTGLVGSLTWSQPRYPTPEQQKELQLLQRQLASALQAARTAAAAGSPAAAGGGTEDAASEAQAVPPQLVQATFQRSWPEPQLLEELGAAGLQELTLWNTHEPPEMPPSYFSHFECLSKLERLEVPSLTGDPLVHSHAFVAAIGRLPALKLLKLRVVPADAACQLPPSVEYMAAEFAAGSNGSDGGDGSVGGDGSDGGDGSIVVDLSHLTALQKLSWTAADEAEGLQALLPRNLRELYMSTIDGSVSSMAGASSVQVAYLHCFKDADVNVLAHLCSLGQLQDLQLLGCRFGTPAASEVAIASLGCATGLTQLCLAEGTLGRSTGLCRQLTKLHNLASLTLSNVEGLCNRDEDSMPMCGEWACKPEEREDMLCLTALTSLTTLELSGGLYRALPDDTVVAALASHLTGLRGLVLFSCSMKSTSALLPALGELTELTSLFLGCYSDSAIGPSDLMHLSRLTRLEELHLHGLECSEAEQQQFLAGMPRLECVKF